MPIYLKQNTASQEVTLGYFVDSTDGNTEETALTINNTDIKLHKAGATTLANKNSGGATHIQYGIYYAVLDATDTDTLGSLVIYCHVTGALAVRVECVVLAANVYDSLIGGGDLLQADVQQIVGAAVSTSTAQLGVNAVSIATGAITATAIAADAIDADALAADAVTEIADGLLKRDMSAVTGEAARSLLNAIRFLRNKWSISGSTLTVTKEDDVTSAWTSALSTNAAADPVNGSDPA